MLRRRRLNKNYPTTIYRSKMAILLYCTHEGLKPLYDDDYDEKKKLKIGQTYKATISKVRNIAFHRKYFGLINLTWEYQNETIREFFHNSKDCFRKTIEIASGWCEPIFLLSHNEWGEQAKSISFDKMTQDEFDNLYSNVLDIIYARFLKGVSQQEFEQILSTFN